MYIVAEYLFIENFIINYLILYGTKSITKTRVKNKRIILTSIILAFYPFVIFFPELYFLTNFYTKVLISIVAVKCVFKEKSNALFLKQLSAFYIFSFVFAGASLGLYFLNSNYLYDLELFNKNFPVKYLILGVMLGGIMIKSILSYYNEKIMIEESLLDILISFNQKTIKIKALIDTGNGLVEPFTNCPVLVVEYKYIRELIPEVFRRIYENKLDNDMDEIQKALTSTDEVFNIRLIPFKSIGADSGMLIGFKPDYISILDDKYRGVYDELIIAIYNDILATDHQYGGLLNQEIMNRGNLIVN